MTDDERVKKILEQRTRIFNKLFRSLVIWDDLKHNERNLKNYNKATKVLISLLVPSSTGWKLRGKND